MRSRARRNIWMPLSMLLAVTLAIGCQLPGLGLARSSPTLTLCALREETVQPTPATTRAPLIAPPALTAAGAAPPETTTAQPAATTAPNCDQAPPAPCRTCYEDALSGGRVFTMYCGACHNARALGERPYASYQNAANHMRVRANLTGEEYRKLMVFLRYWHDIPPQTPPIEPSPKRFFFSQPLSELRPQQRPAPKQETLPPLIPPPGK